MKNLKLNHSQMSSKNKFHIYTITCLANGKVYVGQTVQNPPRKRWKGHKGSARFGVGKKDSIHAAMRYRCSGNFENYFKFEVIKSYPTIEQMNRAEKRWIKKLWTDDIEYGYNRTSGGSREYEFLDEVKAAIGKAQRKSDEQFLKDAFVVHSDKYGYPSGYGKNGHEKIPIECPEHGIFWQTPNSHLVRRCGCPECGNKKKGESQKSNLKDSKKKAIKVHGKRYDYSNFIYINTDTKGIIICKVHGEFLQSPYSHINNKQGCPKCGFERMAKACRKKVVQYNKKGKKIKVWNSIREAERELNINHSAITGCCRGKNKTSGGFVWCYEGEKPTDYHLSPCGHSKKVKQYSLDNVFIKTWSSATEAERELNIHHASISACCTGKRKTTNGFCWKYAK